MCGRERSRPLVAGLAAGRGHVISDDTHGARQAAGCPHGGGRCPRIAAETRQNNRTEVEWRDREAHQRSTKRTGRQFSCDRRRGDGITSCDVGSSRACDASYARACADLFLSSSYPLNISKSKGFPAAASPPKEKQARSVAASFTQPQDRRRECFSTEEPQVLRAPATRGRRRVRHSQRTSGQLSARTTRPARLRPASRPHHDAERAQSASAARWGHMACQ